MLVAALFGAQIAWIADPIPLLTRTMATVIFPIARSIYNSLLTTAYPLLRAAGLRPYPVDVHTYSANIALGIFFVALLALSAFGRRFWCRTFCPLGALLGAPRTMQEAPHYHDVIGDIYSFLAERVEAENSPFSDRQSLEKIADVVRRLPAPGDPIMTMVLDSPDQHLRRLAARLLDLNDEPAPEDMARQILGAEAFEYLAP